jgi:leucyl aminopeptidase (aminopeptidase T)
MFNKIMECAGIALDQCLNLTRKERLLVVCDPPCFEIANAFWETGRSRCREAVIVVIAPRKENGNEPPEPVGSWFSQFDVAVMPTSKSLTHTRARQEACEKGTRIATLPGINPEVFVRTMKTDWKRLGRHTRIVAARLSSVTTVRIQSEAGTDLTFKTGSRLAKADDGMLMTRGSYGNLPAGEAFLAPLEGTAQGKLVIDGSFPTVGLLDKPITLHVKAGNVYRISDHEASAYIKRVFAKYGIHARNIAEFGVGTLDTAIISGNILEDEKVKGTIHVALGDNTSMGGTVKVPIHLDGIIRQPHVWLDDKLWMENGKIIN